MLFFDDVRVDEGIMNYPKYIKKKNEMPGDDGILISGNSEIYNEKKGSLNI